MASLRRIELWISRKKAILTLDSFEAWGQGFKLSNMKFKKSSKKKRADINYELVTIYGKPDIMILKRNRLWWFEYIMQMKVVRVTYRGFIITELTMFQIVALIFFVINARCECKLWNTHWFLYVFLGIFMRYWQPFMSEVLYLHQIFTDGMSNQYTHSDMLTCQM